MVMELQSIYIGIALMVGGLSSLIFHYTIVFFSKDNNKIAAKRNFLILYTGLMIELNLGLLAKYRLTVIYGFLAFLMLYLSICAFIDYKTKTVYSILNLIAGSAGVLFYVYMAIAYEVWKQLDLISVCIFAVVLWISKTKNLFGGGDADVFLVLTIYMCALPDMLSPIEESLFIMIVAVLIQFFVHIKKVDFPHWRLKEPVAFVPAIFFSTVINLLIH